ncbi:hypothetical protein Scep_002618 [Stephania cephalantha]|uniref:Uncharacterized protein n=1 Tax=Stephania cephalantha TaxID=152367 RepID=A0AAP0LA82_9MAGN
MGCHYTAPKNLSTYYQKIVLSFVHHPTWKFHLYIQKTIPSFVHHPPLPIIPPLPITPHLPSPRRQTTGIFTLDFGEILGICCEKSIILGIAGRGWEALAFVALVVKRLCCQNLKFIINNKKLKPHINVEIHQ